MEDFSCLGDETFIEAAYWVSLQRAPDPEGREVYLRLLAKGISKAEILTYLIESPEGRPVGAKVHGLSGARWRARLYRYPGVGTLLRLGESLSPLTQVRSSLKLAFQRLSQIEEQAEARASMAEQGYRDASYGIESVRAELRYVLSSLEENKEDARHTSRLTDSISILQGDIDVLKLTLLKLAKSVDRSEGDLRSAVTVELDATRTSLGNLDERIRSLKAQLDEFETEAERVHASLRMTIYRGLDDLNRTIRRLLDGKADVTAIPALGIELEQKWNARFEGLAALFETLASRRMDAPEIEAVKRDLRASLQAALGGLTLSISGVAASRVDRETIDALLALTSKTVIEQMRREIHELKTSVQGGKRPRQAARKV